MTARPGITGNLDKETLQYISLRHNFILSAFIALMLLYSKSSNIVFLMACRQMMFRVIEY